MLRRSVWFMLSVLLVGFVSWQPRSGVVFGRTPFTCGGTGTLTNGPYDWVNSQFYYNVTGAPANVCGTLHTFRNGSQLDSPGWICTNSSGNATMGPYSGSTNQTDENTYIEWPNGCTTNTVRHISDASPPTISIGSCCNNSFSGTATDVQWGTGFDFGPAAWSGITMTYQDLSTGKYWDGSGYNSTAPINNGGSSQEFFGMTIHWYTAFPPPSSAHNASDSYRWCVWTRDFFYQSNIACQGFTGIP